MSELRTQPDWKELDRLVREAFGAERFALRRRLRSLEQAASRKQPFDRNLQKFLTDVKQSVDFRRNRVQQRPAITYDSELPIVARRDEIAQAIRDNQVVIICGETGSGKSTQLPKICLELGRGSDGWIGHTQPRRIAARSVASRIAQELRCPLGQQVGFKIRFADASSPQTYIKLMTDGILLAECQGDRFLNQYDTLIIDEAHERSLNIDFLLGYLKQMLPRRRDLKLIITSATIDAERFAEHFGSTSGPAPVIQVSGRTYPVEVRYRPLVQDEVEDEPDIHRAVVQAVEDLCLEPPGDLLVFLPTEHDIHETTKLLRSRDLPGDGGGRKTEILPLYARLAAIDQNRVFEPSKYRRIVLATNVAESSLTVPGIRYVIDTGTSRLSRYSPRSKLQRLPIEPISQASADQRKGRCGRVAEGVCVRLYDQADFLARERYTPPEIQRTDLASVILRIKTLQFGEIEEFPFLDPPKTDAIRDGYKTLFELGGLTEQNELTDIGRQLGRLPIDPRMARIILAGETENCLAEVLIIAAALELQDPRERPLDKQQAADECHTRFAADESDFLSYLKLWDFYHSLREKLSRNKLREACKQNFLSYNRLREWQDLHRQLLEFVESAGLKPRARKDEATNIHRALLTGLLSNIAQKSETNEYTVGGGTKLLLWPGSNAVAKKPKWIVAAEQVETSRRYLRTVARIDPLWIEPLAAHLVKRTYSEPAWDRTAGAVMAFERVSLMGLILVPRRRVRFGQQDPPLARQLFLEAALVHGDCDLRAPFWKHNQDLIAHWESLQTRSRRRDLLRGEDALFEFYDQRIPPDISDIRTFERWRKDVERKQPRLLYLSEEDLLEPDAPQIEPEQFPSSLQVRSLDLPLEYRFDPGSKSDGITLVVPQAGLNQVDQRRLGWLVPGLLEEKITALLKGLPKEVRRLFVPIAETARQVYEKLEFGTGDLTDQMARILTELGREHISADWFRQAELPTHLRIHLHVVDAEGETIAQGQDLTALRAQLGNQATQEFSAWADPHWRQTGLTDWSFGDLPAEINLDRAGLIWKGYPALHDDGETVSLKICDTPERAELETRGGLRRLCVLQSGKELRNQIHWLPGIDQIRLQAATLPDAGQLQVQLTDLLADRAFLTSPRIPRTPAEFQQFWQAGKQRIGVATQDLAELLPGLFKEYQAARLMIEQIHAQSLAYLKSDLREQLDDIVSPGFLLTTPWPWLQQFPRYFKSMQVRRQKLGNGAAIDRDQRLLQGLRPAWQVFLKRRESHRQRQIVDPHLVSFRWILEEYRVSLFTQELKTAVPVSQKRLEELWARVRT